MDIHITTAQAAWVAAQPSTAEAEVALACGPVLTEDFKGFGCCFNELGWLALQKLDTPERAAVLDQLFGPQGLALTYGRLPIGANDYAVDWYSHADRPGDFAMEHFSIARDHQAVIPYIRAADAASGGKLRLFASPWCPPVWMKTKKTFNHGALIWEPAYLQAYARYFTRFVQDYGALGLKIDAVHVQNEPDSDQKFPSCLWTGAQLAEFIRDHLGPMFRAEGLDTEIWLGTIERASFNDWVAPTLLDPAARAFVSGVGFQWAGKGAVTRTRQAAPDLPLIQTENECGDGTNSWAYAHYVFDLIQHYLSNGAEAYVYWNAVLEEGGVSTWGWRQNSLITVAEGRATLRPEFHLLRHFAQLVRPGDQVLQSQGSFAGNGVIFRRADGTEVAVMQNPLDRPLTLALRLGAQEVRVTLPPKSFATANN